MNNKIEMIIELGAADMLVMGGGSSGAEGGNNEKSTYPG